MKSCEIGEVGLFDINFDTGERYWSYELRHIFGIPFDTPAEFRLLLQRVHPADRRAFYAAAVQVFRPDCPAHKTSEFRILLGDGRVRWVHEERMSIFRTNLPHDVVRIVGFFVEIAEPTRGYRVRENMDVAA
jgi:PAS fold.